MTTNWGDGDQPRLLIAIVAYGAVQTSGQQVNSLYTKIAGMMQNAAQAAGA